MLIKVFPRDRESLIAILPEYEGEREPVPIGDLIGKDSGSRRRHGAIYGRDAVP